MKENGIYRVIEANRVNVYHYHGSWYEYEWQMVVEDEKGKRVAGCFSTSTSYDQLRGKNVRQGMFYFNVVEKK